MDAEKKLSIPIGSASFNNANILSVDDLKDQRFQATVDSSMIKHSYELRLVAHVEGCCAEGHPTITQEITLEIPKADISTDSRNEI